MKVKTTARRTGPRAEKLSFTEGFDRCWRLQDRSGQLMKSGMLSLTCVLRGFARPWRGPGRKLDDVIEEIDPPRIRRPHGTQVKPSLNAVDLCIDGLVLLESLSVAVLIRPSAGPAC